MSNIYTPSPSTSPSTSPSPSPSPSPPPRPNFPSLSVPASSLKVLLTD